MIDLISSIYTGWKNKGVVMKDEINILLVDDEPSLLDQAKIFLERVENLNVINAASAKEGLALLDDEEIDVIVSDYQMPEINGIEFLKILRESEDDIPFIILTGKGKEEVAMEALNQGADRYLKKEVDPKNLYDLLSKAIIQEYQRWKTERKLEENKKKIKELHQTASELISCEKEEDAYSLIIEGAERILNYDHCAIIEVNDGVFQVKARSSNVDLEKIFHDLVDKKWEGQDSFLKEEKILIEDIQQDDEGKTITKEFDIKSVISLPIEDIGIFQAISKEPKYFDEDDIKISELLLSHLITAVNRIKSKEELKRKEKLYRKVFQTTGSGMALVDEEMKISVANEKFYKMLGCYQETLRQKNFLDFIVEEDRKRVKRYCKRAKENQESIPDRFDIQITTQDENLRHVVVTLGYSREFEQYVFSLLEVS